MFTKLPLVRTPEDYRALTPYHLDADGFVRVSSWIRSRPGGGCGSIVAYVCRKLQLPVEGELPRVKAKTRIEREHYSERRRMLIGEISKNKIELLGCVFESR